MAHIHKLTDVIDTDSYFEIDVNSRTITDRNPIATVLMQGDSNSEEITFKCPRKTDTHDLSDCNRIEIHFINVGSGGQHSDDVYPVKDADRYFVNDDPDNFYFRWTVSPNATVYAGTLTFGIKFICEVGDTASESDYVWNTSIYSGINVGKSMQNSKAIISRYEDLIGHFYNQFVAVGNETLDKLDKKLQEEINNISANEIIPAINAAIEDKKEEAMNYIHSQADEIVSVVLERLPNAEGVSF